jgi:SOUL heme-binding protein
MSKQALKPQGDPQLARYDPPWTLPFLRRNEILIEY